MFNIFNGFCILILRNFIFFEKIFIKKEVVHLDIKDGLKLDAVGQGLEFTSTLNVSGALGFVRFNLETQFLRIRR